MAENETARRHYQPRGSKEDLIKSKSKSTGGMKFISSLINAEETDDAETLIDIKITNPLKKIQKLIEEIKEKQNTTFNLKMTIPLVALPIFIFAVFEFGKTRGTCQQYFTSKVGTVKNIEVAVPEEENSFYKFLKVLKIYYPKSDYNVEERSVLVDTTDNNIINIHSHKKIDLSEFQDKKVIVSGTYSSCTDVITLVDQDNITLY